MEGLAVRCLDGGNPVIVAPANRFDITLIHFGGKQVALSRKSPPVGGAVYDIEVIGFPSASYSTGRVGEAALPPACLYASAAAFQGSFGAGVPLVLAASAS